MCAKDIFNAVGTTIFNGLWGDAKLLYLSVLLALNLVYVSTRPPGKVPSFTEKKSLRTVAIGDALRLALTSYVILIAVRSLLSFLDEGISRLFLNTTILVLFVAVFITLLNTVVADLDTLASRGAYVKTISKWLKTIMGFLLVKANKETTLPGTKDEAETKTTDTTEDTKGEEK